MATEALAMCEALLPELVLLNVNFWDGSNGIALARTLLERWGVPSIFAGGQAT